MNFHGLVIGCWDIYSVYRQWGELFVSRNGKEMDRVIGVPKPSEIARVIRISYSFLYLQSISCKILIILLFVLFNQGKL